MADAFTPAGQLHYGPLYSEGLETSRALEPWNRNWGILGNVNPSLRERQKRMHGRYLSGLGRPSLGAEPDGLGRSVGLGDLSGAAGDDPRYASSLLKDLEAQDDVYGSGIFDAAGSPPTSNAETGVFASHYSLPGYLGREVPYTVSRDISDITNSGEVVMIPAGGLFAIESRGRLTAPPVLGPTPRPPKNRPHRPTTIYDTYVNLWDDSPAEPDLNAGAPVRPPPSYQPARTFPGYVRRVGSSPAARRLPEYPAQTPIPRRDIVAATAFGQDAPAAVSAPSVGELAVAGLLLGAATGLVVSAVSHRSKKGARRR